MALTVKEMLERAQQKYQQARDVLAKEDASADEKASVTTLMAEAKQLKADADALMTIEREGMALEDLKTGASGGSTTKGANASAADFDTFGRFLKAAWLSIAKNQPDKRLSIYRDDDPAPSGGKDMSGESGSSGGFLIPTQFMATIMGAVAESSIVRPRATVLQMSSREIKIPAVKQDNALAAGQPQWFGGLLAYWIGEGELKPATDAAFREITLAAKKLVLFTRTTDELLADAAMSLQSFLTGPQGMAGAIAWYEDFAFLRGTGVAQPLGILNSPALLTIRREQANKVLYLDLMRMLASHRVSRNSRWTLSQTVLTDLMYLQDTEGNLIWNNAVQGMPATILGLPYDVTEKLPAKGTTGDIMLNDFSYYYIGDRQATTIETTTYEAWQYDKTSWRAVHRVDGQPSLNAPWTLQDTTTQLSPFVALSSDVS